MVNDEKPFKIEYRFIEDMEWQIFDRKKEAIDAEIDFNILSSMFQYVEFRVATDYPVGEEPDDSQ